MKVSELLVIALVREATAQMGEAVHDILYTDTREAGLYRNAYH